MYVWMYVNVCVQYLPFLYVCIYVCMYVVCIYADRYLTGDMAEEKKAKQAKKKQKKEGPLLSLCMYGGR